MNQTEHRTSIRLRSYQRILMVLGGSTLITLLVTAATLQPDTRGFGTHQQLGLPPCSFKEMTGLRCPSCGMTTSWSNMMHGKVISSFQANTGGALLAITALFVGPWAVAAGTMGVWLWPRPNEWFAVLAGSTIVICTMVDWCIRYFIFG